MKYVKCEQHAECVKCVKCVKKVKCVKCKILDVCEMYVRGWRERENRLIFNYQYDMYNIQL